MAAVIFFTFSNLLQVVRPDNICGSKDHMIFYIVLCNSNPGVVIPVSNRESCELVPRVKCCHWPTAACQNG